MPQPTLWDLDLDRVFRDHKQTLISRHKTEWEAVMRVLAFWLHFSSFSLSLLSTMTSQMTNRQFVQSRPAPSVQCTRGAGDATLYKLSLKGIPPPRAQEGARVPLSYLHSEIVLHMMSEE